MFFLKTANFFFLEGEWNADQVVSWDYALSYISVIFGFTHVKTRISIYPRLGSLEINIM